MSSVTQIPADRLEKLRKNEKIEAPACDCFPEAKRSADRLPCYTHLGSAASLPALRKILEDRLELKDEAIRIEKIIYTGKEGKTAQGCPIAKWVIRRPGPYEKVLFLVKHRDGHRCSSAWTVVVSVAWEGVRLDVANDLYRSLVFKLTNFGIPTKRQCGINKQRNCACQGTNQYAGASFSFGCSWSMYHNTCKFVRSKVARRFHLSEESEEVEMEKMLEDLATNLAPVYLNMAPDSYFNQIALEEMGRECRLGLEAGRPWSGVTACVDFCAHSHRDVFNMNNGCTTIVTLTKHRGFAKPKDEQLHVLPLYILSDSDEFGSKHNQAHQIHNGGLEILQKYPVNHRYRTTPLLSSYAKRKLAKSKKHPKQQEARMRCGENNRKNSPSPNDGFYEIRSNNEECFVDGAVGGVAIALEHGSVVFECAKQELHASTALKEPNRLRPARIALVFYQHKYMNLRNHGEKEYWERRNKVEVV